MASVLNVVTHAAPPLSSLKPAYGPVKHVFLIGNCGYTHLPMLRLPIKDIEAIEEKMDELARVEISKLTDATRDEMAALLKNPLGAGYVFFAFAGHMAWCDGDPLLLGVDAVGDTEGVSLSQLLGWLAPTYGQKRRADIVLAGCLTQTSTGIPPEIKYPRKGEFVILFPSGFGQVALEPEHGEKSFFVQGLLPHLGKDLFYAAPTIAAAVTKQCGRQTPWVQSNTRSPEKEVSSLDDLRTELRKVHMSSACDTVPLRVQSKVFDELLNNERHAVKEAISKKQEAEALISHNFPNTPQLCITDPYAGQPTRIRIDKISNQQVLEPSMLVISHTAGRDLSDVIYEFRQSGIMQHVVITRKGELLQFVRLLERAWHAGVAFWGPLGAAGDIREHKKVHDVNSHSIGISLEGDGCEQKISEEQYQTLVKLVKALCSHFPIKGRNIVAFAEVAHPPGRHVAPGPKFDWSRLEHVCETLPTLPRLQEVHSIENPDEKPEPHKDWSAWELAEVLQACGYSIHDGHGEPTEASIRQRLQVFMDRYLGEDAWRLIERGNLQKAAEVLFRLRTFVNGR